MRPQAPFRFAAALLGLAASLATAGQPSATKKATPTPVNSYRVIQAFEHNPEDYTQGLVFQDGVFYEGTGRNGHSRLQKYQYIKDKKKVLQSVDLPYQYFGEGIAVLKGKVVQLTWQSERGFLYQASDLKKVGEFSYPGEGWGLTCDDRDFYLSDGSASIRVVDGDKLLNAHQYAVKRTIEVKDQGKPVTMLNELELVRGELFANVWQTDRIAVISPKTGEVLRWIDLSNLISPMLRTGQDSVLNGIAYDAAGNRLFLTGKLWPTLFQIREESKKK
ncbi:glutaminyl-peptide cyclotransferase [Geothrix sp. PMB-07]|uniref:glutaminyl-peptide cyclotransferase n=1 Tax=Geothrix sp. PMB-07 TaxID=3068640 RepID=UPI00274145A1|nr:glutaminyl-peptide cyclotransferase [Geothrix sp. PMB-07]WLT31766.1 glutaminyl-peptide cyclotransferase [Geothrix sp. PMB-07]